MSRRTGVSLVELVVAAAILATLLLFLGSAVDQSARSSRFDLARSEAMTSARRILQQLTRELGTSGGHENGGEHCAPGRNVAAAGLTQLTFAMRTGLSGVEAGDWSTPITYRLVPDGDTPGNGLDDDRDGVQDEQRLERVQDGQTVVLDESVTAFTIDRALGSDVITITLEVSRAYQTAGLVQGPRDWARVRLVTNVYLRNRT